MERENRLIGEDKKFGISLMIQKLMRFQIIATSTCKS